MSLKQIETFPNPTTPNKKLHEIIQVDDEEEKKEQFELLSSSDDEDHEGMTQCQTCCSYIRTPIICAKCNWTTCLKCTQKVLLMSDSDPQCMACKNPWMKDFLYKNCKAPFVNGDFKKHREDVLLEREKNLLPQTQLLLEEELKKESLAKKYHDDIITLHQQLANITRDFEQKIEDKKEEIHFLKYGR